MEVTFEIRLHITTMIS